MTKHRYLTADERRAIVADHPGHAVMRVPLDAILAYDGDSRWVDLGDGNELVRMILTGAVNPGKMVMKKGEKDD